MKHRNHIIQWIGLAMISSVALQASAELPDPGFEISPQRTALVITNPQNDFPSPKDVTWGVVGLSVTENKTVEYPLSTVGFKSSGAG